MRQSLPSDHTRPHLHAPAADTAVSENLIWSISLAAVGILGIYMAGNKSPLGWAVSFGAQLLWVVFAIVTGQLGFILSAVAYGTIYGRNYLRWRKDQREADDVAQ